MTLEIYLMFLVGSLFIIAVAAKETERYLIIRNR